MEERERIKIGGRGRRGMVGEREGGNKLRKETISWEEKETENIETE